MPSEKTFTIGDVSQQTGVASVTLRAWERRYGLIKPQRTAKGHRVYNQGNIQDIQHILSWLNRGVAISKVAALLASGKSSAAAAPVAAQWLVEQNKLLSSITALKEPGLSQLLDRLNKSVPFITLCEYVYQPLQATLAQRWQQQPLGYQLEQQLWQQSWQRQTLIMTLRTEKQKLQGHCYLASLDLNGPSLGYYLLHILLLQSGIRVNAFSKVENLAGLTRLRNSAEWPLIVYAEQRIEQRAFKPLANLSTLWKDGILCCGLASDIHREQLTSLGIDFVGGHSSNAWHSAAMKTWLEKTKR
ncbi:MAG: helix-turn-helix-type transcriptional regulator [Cycloclasticus sp.]|jgi:DNA-binding transcriptional MerR regulator|nr:helix-turn-helix-type transcriptional regulator [Cycloclasticus sp.]MBG97397.1 helix-turn-helix-type transcriptional regulator [Cycloclasticus sp.]HAI96827.1 helix-turn-helix-type transcriptional regulator [Methylococcaceae bacterium]|tara:strand:- start:504 stop:1406 length:903 start_codon:yes stop_codon:yes gene_type:complete